MIDLNELKKLAEAVPELPWEVTGHTVYALEHDGWRKGVEQMRNRFSFSVQRGPETPESELQAIAEFCKAANPAAVLELIATALAAAPQVVADERKLPPLPQYFPDIVNIRADEEVRAQQYAQDYARSALAAAPVQAQEPVLYVRQMDLDNKRDRSVITTREGPTDDGWNVPLYRAPVQPVAVPDGWFVIEADSMAAFRRFYECAMDGEGHDVPASIMKVLAGIGLVQRRYASYYETTDFGLAVLDGKFAAPAAQGDAKDAERWRYFRDSETLCGEVWEEIMHPDERGIKFHAKELDYWVDAAIAAKAAS